MTTAIRHCVCADRRKHDASCPYWIASGELAKELGRDTVLDNSWILAPDTDGVFLVLSSRPGRLPYEMVLTPEGYAVHQGLGCEGEAFKGVLGCRHSRDNTQKDKDMTTALSIASSTDLALVEFDREKIEVMKKTICKGATDAELEMFVLTCQSLQLDPFLKQIWAIQRKAKNPDTGQFEKAMTIQVGIDGYRVMRDRIRDANNMPLFEGMDGPQWSTDGKNWDDFPPAVTEKYAELYARVGVWRRGVPRAFVATARMSAYYQDTSMWKTMGPEQLAKCAESLGYRRAFPAEMSRLPSGPVMDFDESALGEVSTAPTLAVPLDVIEGAEVIDGEVVYPPAEHGAPQQQAQTTGDSATGISDGLGAGPAVATPPVKMPGLHSAYVEEVFLALERAGHSRDTVTAAAQQKHDNKEPKGLTPPELVALAHDFAVNVALPGQPALI